MKQVAYKIKRITAAGNFVQESTGRGFMADNQLVVAQMTNDGTPKCYLKQFDVSKITREYNGWFYGNTTYYYRTPDGETIVQTWYVSYKVLGDC